MPTLASLSSDDLRRLDLRRFNDGVSPYPPGDRSLDDTFAQGIDFYRDTVGRRLRFTGGRVLDLLCGCGRWSVFLAEQNESVVGVDVLEGCTNVARNLCAWLGLANTEFRAGDFRIVREFPDASFDAVWMYSALQYVDRGDALREVQRLLRPGGRLFVGNYNSAGLMVEHVAGGAEAGAVDAGAAKWAVDAMARGSRSHGCGNYIVPAEAREVCAAFGLELLAIGPDGSLETRGEAVETAGGDAERGRGPYLRTVEFVAQKPADRSAEEVVARVFDEQLAALGGADGEARSRAVAVVGTLGASALPMLAARLDTDDQMLAQSIVPLCARLGRAAVPSLIERLDGSSYAWQNAANALIAIGEPAIEDLVDACVNGRETLRDRARGVLAKIAPRVETAVPGPEEPPVAEVIEEPVVTAPSRSLLRAFRRPFRRA